MSCCCRCCCRRRERFEPTMVVYHGSNCHNYAHFEPPKCCCCCCCCPCFPWYPPFPPQPKCDFCEKQTKFVIAQLINYYPTETVHIAMEDGSIAEGTLDSVQTAINKGILCINCVGTPSYKEYINICKIVALSIDNATYNTNIQYLPEPPGPKFCGCEASIKDLLSIDDLVKITIFDSTFIPGKVIKNEYGMVVLECNGYISFIPACKIKKIEKLLEL